MHAEELTVFLGNKGISAVGTEQTDRSCNNFTGTEGLPADFALELPVATIIIVDVMMGSATQRADGIIRNGSAVAALDRLYRFAIFPQIVFEKELPVLFHKGFDDGQLIHFEFLVSGRMGIIESPLFERDISANETKKITDYLLLVLNVLK